MCREETMRESIDHVDKDLFERVWKLVRRSACRSGTSTSCKVPIATWLLPGCYVRGDRLHADAAALDWDRLRTSHGWRGGRRLRRHHAIVGAGSARVPAPARRLLCRGAHPGEAALL